MKYKVVARIQLNDSRHFTKDGIETPAGLIPYHAFEKRESSDLFIKKDWRKNENERRNGNTDKSTD